MVELRRDLHRNPELGFKEERTSAVVEETLSRSAVELRRLVGTGLQAVVRAENSAARSAARSILFRADMDGLPLQEENETPYVSTRDGVMHACGHDGHTSILLHTVLEAQARRGELKGDLSFVFQPAEEGPGGALPMIEAGVMDEPRVEAAFGLHLWNLNRVGTVCVTAGPAMAAADEFELIVEGKGGHGAHPNKTVDAVVVGSHIVTALQTLISRNTDPFETGVVTVGTFHSGSNFNIIAERARMTGTIRTYSEDLRALLVRRVGEVAEGIATALGARCQVRHIPVYPATVNDPAMCDFVAEIAAEVVGADNVLRSERTMGAEDMSYFLQRVPGCFFFLGSSNAEKGLIGQHHSPRFDFDEECLPIGAEIFHRIHERYFEQFPSAPRHVGR